MGLCGRMTPEQSEAARRRALAGREHVLERATRRPGSSVTLDGLYRELLAAKKAA